MTFGRLVVVLLGFREILVIVVMVVLLFILLPYLLKHLGF